MAAPTATPSLLTLVPARLGSRFLRALTRAPAVGREHAGLVSLAAAVCLAIFVTKAALAFTVLSNPDLPPRLGAGAPLRTLGRVAACCAEDAAAGILCVFGGGLALRIGRRRFVTGVAYVVALAALVHVVAAGHVFAHLRCFVTAAHLELLGGMRLERSVVDAISPGVKFTFVALPLLTLALHLAAVRAWPGLWLAAARVLLRPVVAAVLLVILLSCARAAERSLFRDGNGDFARNPQFVLLRSFFTPALPGADDVPADARDFLPGQPSPATQLPNCPRNIVLVVLESAAAQYLDVYGSPLPTTPRLKAMRDKGVVFENFYATTNHSIGSALPLFGSTYNDVDDLATLVNRRPFPMPSAAEWLRRRGYRAWFVGAGGSRSWQDYERVLPDFAPGAPFADARDPRHPFWSADPERFRHDDYLDVAAFDDARRFLREAGDGPFFLVVWNYATHYPYRPHAGPQSFPAAHFPPAARSNAEKKQLFLDYLRSLWSADTLIGELYAEVERLGLADDTLLVVTADHGEGWGQHGYFLHGQSLYEEEVRVPLVMISPALAPLPRRVGAVGSHVDLWPTIMDICGLPCDSRWQGRSLLAPEPEGGRRAYFSMKGGWLGVREGRYKYLWDVRNDRRRLFDLHADPGEGRSVAGRHPELCARLHRRLLDWIAYQKRHVRELAAGR